MLMTMKRTARIILTLSLAVLLLLSPALAEEFACVKDTGSLNVRLGPDTSYSKLGYITRGQWVEVIGESGNWYYVRSLDGKLEGYASKNFLSRGSSGVSGTGVVKNPVSTQFLNLRQYPSLSAPVLGIYYNGTVFTVLENLGDWVHVNVNGVQGYFSSGYVSLQGGGTAAWVRTPNGGNVNLRSGPSTSYSVVGSASNGSRITVLQQGTGFSRVSVGERTGFLSNQYISDSSSSPITPRPPVGEQGYCIVRNSYSSYVNLRASASTGAKVLEKGMNGTRYTMITAGSEWCRVLNPSTGREGYMMTRYLELHDCAPYRTVKNGNSYVNLRSGSSKSTRVLQQVPSGAVVTVISPGSTWCRVSYSGRTGYMMTSFLK